MISAEVILDSVSPQGHRLTTFKLRYPRFIHSEVMTHRVFSRNASSSRAVPIKKRIAEAQDSLLRAEPAFWGKEQKGMQSHVELEGYPDNRASKGLSPKIEVQIAWGRAAINAAHEAEQMMKFGAHKQIVNRILEPFIHIDVVVTATEYMNFFGLRLDGDADPTMRALAEAMWRAYSENRPVPVQPGGWHLPFVGYGDGGDGVAFDTSIEAPEDVEIWKAAQRNGFGASDVARKISVARCARVSYMSHETGKRSTVEEDLRLYDRLVGSHPLHASPAEHQATPDELKYEYMDAANDPRIGYGTARWDHPTEHRNFIGWRQYRAMLPGEAVAPLPEKYR